MGSFSRVERTTGDKATYELYGSGDLLGRLLHNRRFDIAMVAVLDCLKQTIDWVKSQDTSVEFPHQYVICLDNMSSSEMIDPGLSRTRLAIRP
jgi:beclin